MENSFKKTSTTNLYQTKSDLPNSESPNQPTNKEKRNQQQKQI